MNKEKIFLNRENSLGGVEMGMFSLGLHKLGLAILLDLSLSLGTSFIGALL